MSINRIRFCLILVLLIGAMPIAVAQTNPKPRSALYIGSDTQNTDTEITFDNDNGVFIVITYLDQPAPALASIAVLDASDSKGRYILVQENGLLEGPIENGKPVSRWKQWRGTTVPTNFENDDAWKPQLASPDEILALIKRTTDILPLTIKTDNSIPNRKYITYRAPNGAIYAKLTMISSNRQVISMSIYPMQYWAAGQNGFVLGWNEFEDYNAKIHKAVHLDMFGRINAQNNWDGLMQIPSFHHSIHEYVARLYSNGIRVWEKSFHEDNSLAVLETRNSNKHYFWQPAFNVQVFQEGEIFLETPLSAPPPVTPGIKQFLKD